MLILLYFLLSVHVIMTILMILVTLMQRPRSEGLGAAFGGGMTDNIFGAQTTNVLAKFTTWLGGAFFVVTLVLAMLYARMGSAPTNTETDIQKQLQNISAAETPAAADTDATTPATEAPAAITEESAAANEAETPAPTEDAAIPAAEETAPETEITEPAAAEAARYGNHARSRSGRTPAADRGARCLPGSSDHRSRNGIVPNRS